MKDDWKRVKRRIRTIWDDYDFSDKELRQGRGNLMSMVRLIHRKTGEPRNEIMFKMDAVV